MNMNDWARNEIEIACKKERGTKDINEFDYGVACYESAYKAFQSLLKDEHSGLSIVFTQQILNRLIEHKPLTPIEDTPDIWTDVSDESVNFTSYMCKRMSSLFKDVYEDGTIVYSDVDRFYCLNKDNPENSGWRNGFVSKLMNEQFPITLPYYPPSKPYYVYCTEGLSNSGNGDFDTLGIWYVLTPYGEHVDINKFFKESSTGFTEIKQEEYENRIKCIELNPCPKCGYIPKLSYACGEFFIIGRRDCSVCGEFKEMHATEEQELEAWNRMLLLQMQSLK